MSGNRDKVNVTGAERAVELCELPGGGWRPDRGPDDTGPWSSSCDNGRPAEGSMHYHLPTESPRLQRETCAGGLGCRILVSASILEFLCFGFGGLAPILKFK